MTLCSGVFWARSWGPCLGGFQKSFVEAFGGPRSSRPLKALRDPRRPRLLQEFREKWEFRALARNPKRNQVGRMPARAGGRKNKQPHRLLVCWAREMCRRQICRLLTALGVLGRHFYMLPPAAAEQDALNPGALNPETLGLRLGSGTPRSPGVFAVASSAAIRWRGAGF